MSIVNGTMQSSPGVDVGLFHTKKGVSEMRAPLRARREPAGGQNRPSSVLYIFEHKRKIY